jgi:DeoR/GlpR family transcriptional regulator of sugar metabolism
MLLVEREKEIVNLVNKRGAISVRDLAQLCQVTEVTIRRDLKKLEELNLLQRTHGGAARKDALLTAADAHHSGQSNGDFSADALIIAPVQSRAAHLLRERAMRSRIPLIAESAALAGAVYLGPDNYQGAHDLGRWAARYVHDHMGSHVCVLDITLRQPNTEARSQGFIDSLRETLGNNAVEVVTVDGRGLYNEAYTVALDALRVHPQINLIFGVNDDSVLAGLQAYLDLERDPDTVLAVNVGGEGKTLFDMLYRGSPLKACLALFPEIVGRKAIESALQAIAGNPMDAEIITPGVVVTRDNLTEFYTLSGDNWLLNNEAAMSLPQTRWEHPLPPADDIRVSFAIHFRTHEWYQNVAAAMQTRADELGVHLSVEDVNEDVQAEIVELRRLIGKLAAAYIRDGETILLDAGTSTLSLAQYLDDRHNLTVITNSYAVFQRLQRNPSIRLFLTGGEFQREAQAFVGHGASLILRELRADKAFIVAGGVSTGFGISCKDTAEAEVRRAMIDAAREVVLLADHTLLGFDANIRVTGLERVHTLITDAGAQAQQRLELNQRGVKVLVAGQVAATES